MFRFTGGPSFDALLDDLPTHDNTRIARYLGVSDRTLRRWRASNNPPRLVYLALFWETRWGVETINCQAVNDARIAYGLARALEDQVKQLRGRIAYLVGLADFGSANAPSWRDETGQPPAPENTPASTAPAGGTSENGIVKELASIATIGDAGSASALAPTELPVLLSGR